MLLPYHLTRRILSFLLDRYDWSTHGSLDCDSAAAAFESTSVVISDSMEKAVFSVDFSLASISVFINLTLESSVFSNFHVGNTLSLNLINSIDRRCIPLPITLSLFRFVPRPEAGNSTTFADWSAVILPLLSLFQSFLLSFSRNPEREIKQLQSSKMQNSIENRSYMLRLYTCN